MIPSLDGLRAFSLMVVFASHVSPSPFIPGGFGVTVFFFLSGYLITTLMIREYERDGSLNVGAFYLRRLLRLSPPLLFSLAVVYLGIATGLVPGQLDAAAIASQALYFHNYYLVYFGTPNDTTIALVLLWSLAVEEHFYMLYPILFLLVARRIAGLGTVGAILVLVLLWRCVRFFVLGDDEWTIYLLTDTRIDSILWGCFLAFWQARGISERVFTPGRMWPMLALSGVILLAAFVIRDEAFRSTIRYTLQGMALMPIFHYAVHHPNAPVFRVLNLGPVRRLGELSYTFYIIHAVIISALAYHGVSRAEWVMAPAAFIVSYAYAAFLHRTIEAPFRHWRRALGGPAPKAASGQA